MARIRGPFINETWYTGFVQLKNNDQIFYWWFESRSSPAHDPLVLWLSGGPGASSLFALFYENGPYQLASHTIALKGNPFSWNNHANLLYVDQPVGTGFSTPSKKILHEEEMAESMVEFLARFLEIFWQLQGRDFYITGESYAGHFIPAISYKIKFAHANRLKINLKGLAIGNGFVDPYHQYATYAAFAKENNLIDGTTMRKLEDKFKLCQILISKYPRSRKTSEACEEPVRFILSRASSPATLRNDIGIRGHFRFNPFDIRKRCDFWAPEQDLLCYNFSLAGKLLRVSKIKQLLGVPTNQHWKLISPRVHTALQKEHLISFSPQISSLLEASLDILVYYGDKDYEANWRGGEAWTRNCKWSGQAKFNSARYVDWEIGGIAVGALKSHKNLKFLRVFDAGHMVPMDKPKAALTMLESFIDSSLSNSAPKASRSSELRMVVEEVKEVARLPNMNRAPESRAALADSAEVLGRQEVLGSPRFESTSLSFASIQVATMISLFGVCSVACCARRGASVVAGEPLLTF